MNNGEPTYKPENYNTSSHLNLASHPQNLKAVIVANTDPIWLHGRPLNLVDFTCCRVSQNGVFNRPRHLLYIPYECLVVIGCVEIRVSIILMAFKEFVYNSKYYVCEHFNGV